jgi:hypothetical protein
MKNMIPGFVGGVLVGASCAYMFSFPLTMGQITILAAAGIAIVVKARYGLARA